MTQPIRYRVDADEEGAAERGLASLVLTVIELLRQLMERQAIRRVEDGSVTGEQAERLGYTLMRLDERMGELIEHFGLDPGDLNLDLGPLGTLLPEGGAPRATTPRCTGAC
jgi:Gas vesicle protein K